MMNYKDKTDEELELIELKKALNSLKISHQNNLVSYKNTDTMLQENEKKFRMLVENSKDIIYTLSNEGIFIYVSPVWTSILGHSVNQVEGFSFQQFVHPDDIPGCMKFLKRVLETGQIQDSIEYRVQHIDGSWRWHTSSAVPMKDIEGNISGFQGLARDITNAKNNIDIIKQASTRLTLATKAGGIGVWDFDFINNYLMWDNQMFVLYQVDKTNFNYNYESWMATIHPDDYKRVDSELQLAINSSKDYDIEFRIIWPDASVHIIRANATIMYDNSGKPLRMIGNNWDITEQKKLEEKLSSSELNFRTLFETLDDMIFIVNEQAEIIYINESVNLKLGYSIHDLQGMSILSVHPKNQHDEAAQIFSDTLIGKRISLRLPLQRKDGILVPVETRVWFGKWNGENCLFGISKDLSKEQEALQKFNKIFDNNPASMAISTVDERKFTDVNATFLNSTGYSREEIIGKTSTQLDLFVQTYDQGHAAIELEKTGYLYNHNLQLKTKSGKIIDGLFFGAIIEINGQEYFLTVMTDVTKQKKAENDLRQLTNRLTALISHLSGGILLETFDRKIQQVNQNFCNIFRIPASAEALSLIHI